MYKPFKVILKLRNGMSKIERMSKREVAHLVRVFRGANHFGGNIESARILWLNTGHLFLELN